MRILLARSWKKLMERRMTLTGVGDHADGWHLDLSGNVSGENWDTQRGTGRWTRIEWNGVAGEIVRDDALVTHGRSGREGHLRLVGWLGPPDSVAAVALFGLVLERGPGFVGFLHEMPVIVDDELGR